jgi:hypothetical protein
MPVVPIDYRADKHFLPQTKIKDTDRLDLPVSSGLETGEIVRVGHWLIPVSDGVDRPAATTEYDVAWPSWVEWDYDELVGFPDANRLGQITLLMGPHRAKTRFYARVSTGLSLIPEPGMSLTVVPALAGDVAEINTEAGETVCALRDGILSGRSAAGKAAGLDRVAKCIEVSGGYCHYVTT